MGCRNSPGNVSGRALRGASRSFFSRFAGTRDMASIVAGRTGDTLRDNRDRVSTCVGGALTPCLTTRGETDARRRKASVKRRVPLLGGGPNMCRRWAVTPLIRTRQRSGGMRIVLQGVSLQIQRYHPTGLPSQWTRRYHVLPGTGPITATHKTLIPAWQDHNRHFGVASVTTKSWTWLDPLYTPAPPCWLFPTIRRRLPNRPMPCG